ncbi:MAG: hypothetical protein STSR0004_22200 [Peptococcaceae bacterium]
MRAGYFEQAGGQEFNLTSGVETKIIGLAHTIEWFRQNWDKIETGASFGPGMSSAVRGYK